MADVRLFFDDPEPTSTARFIEDRLIFLSVDEFVRYDPTRQNAQGVGLSNYETIYQAYGDEQRERVRKELGFTGTEDQIDGWELYLQGIILNQRNLFAQGQTGETEEFEQLMAALTVIEGPVTLYCPSTQISKETIGVETPPLFVFRDFPAFIDDQIQRIVGDPKYVRAAPLQLRQGQEKPGLTYKDTPAVSVWMWCKALGNPTDFEGGFIDLTPWVMALQTSVATNGGNFSLTLPPLTGKANPQGGWDINREALNIAGEGQFALFRDSVLQALRREPPQTFDNRSSSEQIQDAADDNFRRKNFIFHEMIQSNDLIFIKFEKLQLEEQGEFQARDRRITDPITASDLPNQIYDLIGLVDSSSFNYSPAGNDVQITITGRDLSKLYLEDGTYFYPLEAPYYDGENGLFSYQSRESLGRSVQRVFGSLQLLNAYLDRTIEFTLRFIVNQLANIQVCGDNVFSFFQDKSRKFSIQPVSREQQQRYNEILQQRQARWKQDADFVKGNKALAEAYSQIEWQLLSSLSPERRISLIRSRTSDRILEPIQKDLLPTTDDDGNVIQANVNANTATINARVELFYSRLQANNQPLPEELQPQVEEQLQAGVWQIVRLVIDQNIARRRVVDSSIATQSGSIVNFIRKVVQEPFVEFYSDTYGDRFYWIVRRPPTTRESYRSNKTITVYGSEVFGEQLSFDDQQVYTWYRLIPQGNYMGAAQIISLYDFPAIYFREFAEIWGSRPLEVVSNYIDYKGYIDYEEPRSNEKKVDLLRAQAIEDLRYVIESYAYRPFTRRGQIVIRGDRRIKRGMNIFYRPTGELFYVDAVTQSYSIGGKVDRQTVLQVSRGMVLEYYDAYFDLIDYQTRTAEVKPGEGSREVPDYRVNNDVFLFLLHRRQFLRGQQIRTGVNDVEFDRLSRRDRFIKI